MLTSIASPRDGGNESDNDNDDNDLKISVIEHRILPGILLGILNVIWYRIW